MRLQPGSLQQGARGHTAPRPPRQAWCDDPRPPGPHLALRARAVLVVAEGAGVLVALRPRARHIPPLRTHAATSRPLTPELLHTPRSPSSSPALLSPPALPPKLPRQLIGYGSERQLRPPIGRRLTSIKLSCPTGLGATAEFSSPTSTPAPRSLIGARGWLGIDWCAAAGTQALERLVPAPSPFCPRPLTPLPPVGPVQPGGEGRCGRSPAQAARKSSSSGRSPVLALFPPRPLRLVRDRAPSSLRKARCWGWGPGRCSPRTRLHPRRRRSDRRVSAGKGTREAGPGPRRSRPGRGRRPTGLRAPARSASPPTAAACRPLPARGPRQVSVPATAGRGWREGDVGWETRGWGVGGFWLRGLGEGSLGCFLGVGSTFLVPACSWDPTNRMGLEPREGAGL